MDEQYLMATARYIELNPVKVGIVKKPEEYKWSSARAHIQREDDILVKKLPHYLKSFQIGRNCSPVI
jgi:putative transposase